MRAWLILAAAVVAGVAAAGALGPPPRETAVSTDRLGPEAGEAVADYAARAGNSLTEDSSAPRWALVSLRSELTPAAAADLTAAVRVSQVLYRVPMPRIASPVVWVSVPAGRAALLDSADTARSLLRQAHYADDRSRRVAAVAAARIAAGLPGVAALVVSAPPARLRALRATPQVRTVEALPPDASRFGVTPLLPDQLDRALPTPDDAPVPEGL